MTLHNILTSATLKDASDVFIIAGIPITYKIKGMQDRDDSGIMKPDAINAIIDEIYEAAGREKTNLDKAFDDDFSFSSEDSGSIYSGRGVRLLRSSESLDSASLILRLLAYLRTCCLSRTTALAWCSSRVLPARVNPRLSLA